MAALGAVTARLSSPPPALDFPLRSVKDVDSAGNAHDLNILCLQASLEDYRKAKQLADDLQAVTARRQQLAQDIERLNVEVEQAYQVEQEKNARICHLEEMLERDGLDSIERVRERDIAIRNQQAAAQDARRRFVDRTFELESSLELHRMHTAAAMKKVDQLKEELAMERLIHQRQAEKIEDFENAIAANKDELQQAAEHIAALETARAAELEKGRAADAQIAALEQQRVHDESGLKGRLQESEVFARALEQARNSEYLRNKQRDFEIQHLSNHSADQARHMAEQATDAHDLIAALNSLLHRQEQSTRQAGLERTMERTLSDRDAWRAEQRLRSNAQRIEQLAQQAALTDAHLAAQVRALGSHTALHLSHSRSVPLVPPPRFSQSRHLSIGVPQMSTPPLSTRSLSPSPPTSSSPPPPPQTHAVSTFRHSPSRTADVLHAPPAALITRSLAGLPPGPPPDYGSVPTPIVFDRGLRR